MPAHLDLISPNYRKLLAQVHASGQFGAGAGRHAHNIAMLAAGGTVLDYGCATGKLAEALPELNIAGYDPAIPRFSAEPNAANLVVCTDVLEHIEPDKLPAVLHHIHGLAVDYAYLGIATRPDGSKLLPDGRNPHLIIQSASWWKKQLERLFEIKTWETTPKEVIAVVKPLPITVVLWKWSNGWREGVYNSKHVDTMCKMVNNYLSVPHRIVCITDDPRGITQCETMPLWDFPIVKTQPRKPNCYRRLRMFDQWAEDAIGKRFISMDLDGVILRDIDHLVQRDEDFVILEGRAAPYNGSIWMHRTGTRRHVWDDFDPDTSPGEAASQKRANGRGFYGSDQAWISHKLRGEATYTHAKDGVSQFGICIHNGMNIPPNQSIVFFAGSLKPWDSHMSSMSQKLYQEYMRWMNA